MSSPLFHGTYNNTSAEEKSVWTDLKAGDKRALSTIYTKYFSLLYNYGSRITQDIKLAEDCIQDLFCEIWNKRMSLGDVINIKAYLYKSLRRKIVYQLTQQTKSVDMDELQYFEMQFSDKTHYLHQTFHAEISEKLRHLVEELTPKQKEAIFLIYFDELSYEEASSIMCLKTKTVYNLVNLAIGKLRERKDQISNFIRTYML